MQALFFFLDHNESQWFAPSSAPIPIIDSLPCLPNPAITVRLTTREQMVLKLKLEGYSAKAIAKWVEEKTGKALSYRTVQTHLQHIYSKTGTKAPRILIHYLPD